MRSHRNYSVAAAVAATVASQVASGREVARHPDLDAYDHYLAGRAMLYRRDVDGALAELGKAIEIDPNFAETHAEWGIARLMGQPAREALESGRKAIDRALELQPTLLRAQAAEGFRKLQVQPPRPAAAEATLQAILAQDPNMSDAMLWLHNSLMAQGRSDEALGILKRAARIDPLHPSITSNLAEAFAQRGEVDEAIAVLKRALEPPNPAPGVFSSLVDPYRRLGRLVELNAVAKDQSLRGGLHHYWTAQSYGLIGNWAAATCWLERSQIAAGWREYYLRQNDPYWAAIEGDPRYRALMAQVRKDVDKQRAEIARIDARDDFVAKIDAAMAARRAAGR